MLETIASFCATIAFGVLAILCLLLAGLWFGDAGVVACALVAAGTAYLSQMLFTTADLRASHPWAGYFLWGGFIGQFVSALAWFVGLCAFVAAGA